MSLDVWGRLVIVSSIVSLAGCGDDGVPGDSGVADGGADAADAAPDGDAGPVEPPGLAWEDCEGAYRCAWVTVPVDHSDPDGATLEIRILRSPAPDGASRGVLFANPGGPGGRVIEAAATLLPAYSYLLPRFDIILMDPRGIGRSSQIDCIDDADYEAAAELPLEPESDAEWAAVDAFWQGFRDDCHAMNDPALLANVDSESVARDMDLVREALGEEKISYAGVSYGSYLGGIYASLFPDRVDAFVFDSVGPPSPADTIAELQQSGRNYEAELDRFFAECGADATCAFHPGEGAAALGAAWDALEAAAGAEPGPAVGSRRVTPFHLIYGTAERLRAGRHADLAEALAAAEGDDWTELLAGADRFTGRAEDGWTNLVEANIAIYTLDHGCPPGYDIAAARAALADLVADAPRIGVARFALSMSCLHPLAERSDPVFSVSAPTAPPVLVLGGAYDPATPAATAEEMVSALDNGSHYILYEGAGHGYSARSGCILDAVVAFFTDPTMPPGVSRCP